MQRATSLEPGAIVTGGYRVVRPVAAGGMGSVYEVEQLATGARRALKAMHVQLASDPDLRARFVREARVAATIPSDHVADVLDAGVDEATGLPFLVMELLDGLTLSRELRRRGFFDWGSVREVFRQLCHAVAAAHVRGIVHRDLKPANVFLARPRTAGMPFVLKVLDFGIAEVVASVRPERGGIIGTPAWMAPEQADPRAPIGPTADVWALGLIAFTLFTGRPYWPMANLEGAPSEAMMSRLAGEEIASASIRAAGYGAGDRLPPGFDAWFDRCVVREVSRRFANGAEAHAGFAAMMSAALGVDSRHRSLPPLTAPEESPAATLEEDVSTHAPTRPVIARRDRDRRGRWLLAAAGIVGAAVALLAGRASKVEAPLPPHTEGATIERAAPEPRVIARIHGSNTIGAELAPALAEAFLAREIGGAAPVRKQVAPDELLVVGRAGDGTTAAIEIQAHGSATAFKDLAAGTCDVGMASRRIRPEEVDALASLGPMASAASEHVIALDGIAVIVNPASPVLRLSTEQLGGIFAGRVTRWSEVGGQDAPVTIYARDDRSGTFDTFKSLVLGARPLAPAARRFESSDDLADAVAADATGIGFVGLAQVRSAKAVMVREASSAPMLPSPATVATEDYPLSRRLYLYTPAAAIASARRFVDFALSDEGQAVVARAGFVDLRPACDPNARPHFAWDTALTGALASACRLSIDFRFDSASKQLDTRALRDLQRLSALLTRGPQAGRRVVLLGFSDGVGRRADNDSLSLARATAVADQLRARGLPVDLVRGLGSQLPVADDASEAGRQRNRRVEAWLL